MEEIMENPVERVDFRRFSTFFVGSSVRIEVAPGAPSPALVTVVVQRVQEGGYWAWGCLVTWERNDYYGVKLGSLGCEQHDPWMMYIKYIYIYILIMYYVWL